MEAQDKGVAAAAAAAVALLSGAWFCRTTLCPVFCFERACEHALLGVEAVVGHDVHDVHPRLLQSKGVKQVTQAFTHKLSVVVVVCDDVHDVHPRLLQSQGTKQVTHTHTFTHELSVIAIVGHDAHHVHPHYRKHTQHA